MTFLGVIVLSLTSSCKTKPLAEKWLHEFVTPMQTLVNETRGQGRSEELAVCAYGFFEEKGRWPDSREEFAAFASYEGLANPIEDFNTLSFATRDDGSCLVQYQSIYGFKVAMTLPMP